MAATELWNQGGVCIHPDTGVLVEDTTGMKADALAEARMCSPVHLQLYVVAFPDGLESATASITMDDHEISIDQAERVAKSLLERVELYRAWDAQQLAQKEPNA